MLISLAVVVIGFALTLSGLWQQQLFAIVLGMVMMGVGWVLFIVKWRKAAKIGNKQNHER